MAQAFIFRARIDHLCQESSLKLFVVTFCIFIMSQQMSSTSAQGIPVSIDGAIGVSVEQQQQSSATGPLAELFIDDSVVDVSVHDNIITVNDNLTNTTITPGDSVRQCTLR